MFFLDVLSENVSISSFFIVVRSNLDLGFLGLHDLGVFSLTLPAPIPDEVKKLT